MSVGIRHSQQYNEKMNDSKVYWNMKETNPGIWKFTLWMFLLVSSDQKQLP